MDSKCGIDSPLQLARGKALPNRIAKAAMSERLAGANGQPNAAHLRLYERWATSGAGLLITGNVMVDPKHLGESGNVYIEPDTDPGVFRTWSATAKAGGALLWMQINHPGRQSPRALNKTPVAPSAVPMDIPGNMYLSPRELESSEIDRIIEDFARAAKMAETSGFDGVQIHGAHGYLISQFLSPRTNQRSDKWGGDASSRRRFLNGVIEAVREATGPDFQVALKLNSADFQKGGFTEEESMQVITNLTGVDLLEISGGTYEALEMFKEPGSDSARTKAREGFFLDFASKLRDFTGIPLMVTGGFRTKAGMKSALESGATDAIGMARPLVLEPDLPDRLLTGQATAAAAVRLGIGIKILDGMIQGGWYQAQISRMGKGNAPSPRMSRFWGIWQFLLADPHKVASKL